MLRLSIPDDDKEYLTELFRVDQAKRNNFLKKIKTDNNIEDFATSFQEITNLNPRKANEIIRVLFNIYDSFDTSKEEEIEKFASALIEAFEESTKNQLKKPLKVELESFKEFFIKMLSMHDKFGIKAKVLRLMPQHQHLFVDSTLYSDIRPVFKHGQIVKPSAAIIVHSLKIVYQENMETKDFYLGLSDADLQQLKSTIERAIAKHECLKLAISDFGMKYLQMERE